MSEIYYKAFTRDMMCRDQQYKEGEVYEIKDRPILCEKGFHFCKALVLTIDYYPIANEITENRYAEVEVLGDVVWEEPNKHKGVTNKIRIKRVFSDDEVNGLVDKNNNSGKLNSGDLNSGYRNSGYRNSGNRNSGNRNSGHSNSGDRNSGNRNSGNRNSGHRNSGNSNSGDLNSGDWNSGYRNSGHSNSGDWNACHKSTGCFNTNQPKYIKVFNKKCLIEDWENSYIPNFLYFDIDTDIGYKGSFQKSWEEADKTDREKVKDLPNFNAKVFYKISGIKV